MVYMNNFIAVVKHKGKVLRERGGFVTLPFGAEYELLLKNKNSVKAVASVEVDGQDVLSGHQLILNPNSSMTLKGFMDGMRVKNRFRFIHKTKEIADYRGDRVDDGLIRVEFRFEQRYSQPVITYTPPQWPSSPNWTYYNSGGTTFTSGGTGGHAFYNNSSGQTKSVKASFSCDSYNRVADAPADDEGITVKGSRTNQSFVYGYTGTLEDYSDVIILRLRGFKKSGKIVRKPITVKSRLTCSTCGRKSRSSSKFCSNCGTYLE